MAHRRRYFMAFLSLFVLFSCTVEYRLAKLAGERVDQAHVMLIFPDYLLVKNSKDYGLDTNLSDNQYYQRQLDSSFFLRYIDDSTYLHGFSAEVKALFQEFGFKVYEPQQWSVFLALKEQAFIVDFTQLQVEERWFLHTDEETMPDEYTYTQETWLNALSYNAWVTVSDINDSAFTSRKMIYTEEVLHDHYEGVFLMNNISGEVYYDYNNRPLKVEDAKRLISNASIDISMDVLDFMINNYVEEALLEMEQKYPERFWKYRPKKSKPYPVMEESGYIIMEE
jgi:hypothetical protein